MHLSFKLNIEIQSLCLTNKLTNLHAFALTVNDVCAGQRQGPVKRFGQCTVNWQGDDYQPVSTELLVTRYCCPNKQEHPRGADRTRGEVTTEDRQRTNRYTLPVCVTFVSGVT